MYFGIDIGGTNIRIAAAESLEEPKLLHKVSFANLPNYEADIAQIVSTIRAIDPKPEGIGIGMPGRHNETSTAITNASYVSQWVNKPFVATLKSEFSCPVVLEHDTVMAAVGEALYGSHTKEDFCFLIYGTGCGMAFVTLKDGRAYARNGTDEEHALYLKPWQSDCGGRGIEDKYGKPAAELSEEEWDKIMDDFYGYLVKFIEDFKPKTVVYSGGIANKQWSRLEKVIDRLHSEEPHLDCDISLSTLGEDAGLYGALGINSLMDTQAHTFI